MQNAGAKGVPRGASWCSFAFCRAFCVCSFAGICSHAVPLLFGARLCCPLLARRATRLARVRLGGPLAVSVSCVASARACLLAGVRLLLRSFGNSCCGLLCGFLLGHRTSQPSRAFLGGPLEVFALRGCSRRARFGVLQCTGVSQAYAHVRAINASA